MRIGKLDNDQLNGLILSKFRHVRKEVVCSPRVGVDCAAVDLGGRLAVLSTDPITSAAKNLGQLTVHVSCNDAAAAGAEPVGLLVTLLVPPTATESDIARVADELASAAEQAGVEIIGGHTEVTDSVTRMVTCATVLAKAGARGVLDARDMRPGNDLVLTKSAGLEGAAILAGDHAALLSAVPEFSQFIFCIYSSYSIPHITCSCSNRLAAIPVNCFDSPRSLICSVSIILKFISFAPLIIM